MSRRGRPPKPNALKLLAGTYRPDRANASEPRPEIREPEPPEFLSPYALAEWNRVAPALVALGLLSELDRAALVAYCDTWAQYVEAARTVQREGLTVPTNSGGVKKHPAMAVVESAGRELLAWAREFGMTPASRSRVSARVPKGRNPFDELLP